MIVYKKKLKVNLNLIFLLIIIGWPLIHSFFGIDMADTGLYLYNYQHPFSETVSLMTFLATIIGYLWYSITSFLGLWGLNLLEILIEWASCYFVYKLLKEEIRKEILLFGITLSLLICDTYINVYNFHQLNMLLMIMAIYFLYKGLINNKLFYCCISGILVGISVFVRLPSITSIILIFPIIIWKYYNSNVTRKDTISQIVSFLSGFILSIIVILLIYMLIFGFDYLLEEFNRALFLSKGESGTSQYGFLNVFIFLIKDSMASIEIGLLLLVYSMLIGFFITRIKYYLKDKKLYSFLFFCLACVVLLLIFYSINSFSAMPQGWAKLSSFGWIYFGILLICGIYYSILGTYSDKYKKIGLLGVLGILLNYLVFMGSGVRFRHTILGMWILMPLVFHFLYKLFIEFKNKWLGVSSKIIFLICIVLISNYLITTNMYDDSNIFNLNSKINSKETKLLFTTQRQAETVNDVLNILNNSIYDNKELLVYGDSVLLYELSNKEAYVRPWINVSSYSIKEFSQDLEEKLKENSSLPLIVICRTSSYFGFDEVGYLSNLERTSQINEKKMILNNFITNNEYKLVYENEYYSVYE